MAHHWVTKFLWMRWVTRSPPMPFEKVWREQSDFGNLRDWGRRKPNRICFFCKVTEGNRGGGDRIEGPLATSFRCRTITVCRTSHDSSSFPGRTAHSWPTGLIDSQIRHGSQPTAGIIRQLGRGSEAETEVWCCISGGCELYICTLTVSCWQQIAKRLSKNGGAPMAVRPLAKAKRICCSIWGSKSTGKQHLTACLWPWLLLRSLPLTKESGIALPFSDLIFNGQLTWHFHYKVHLGSELFLFLCSHSILYSTIIPHSTI